MAEFLLIVLVVGAFLGVFFVVCKIHEKRELRRYEQQDKARDKEAA